MGSVRLLPQNTSDPVLREIFDLFDSHRTHHLRCTELRTALLMVGSDATREQLQAFESVYCGNARLGYTFDEFCAVVEVSKETERQVAPHDHGTDAITKCFDDYDSDHSGQWTARQLVKWTQDLQATVSMIEKEGNGATSSVGSDSLLGLSEADMLSMMAVISGEGSSSGAGRISREEFLRLLSAVATQL